MTFQEIINNEEFLDLLDAEDSESMSYYISNKIPFILYDKLQQMFDDLEIFQDIAIYSLDKNKKYKYALQDTYGSGWWYDLYDKNTPADLRDMHLYPKSVWNLNACNIVIDSTTTLEQFGIYISTPVEWYTYKLTFLGIPKFINKPGISLEVQKASQIEIYAKKDLINDVKKLFEENYIRTNKPSLRNKIKEI